MNFLLLITALVLFILIAPLAIIYKLITNLFKLKKLNDWLLRIALSIDQLGNVVADDFFNLLLIKNDCFSPFGDEDETISSVLGKNYQLNNLTFLGELLRKLLYVFDKNHSVDSIEEDEKFIKEKK